MRNFLHGKESAFKNLGKIAGARTRHVMGS